MSNTTPKNIWQKLFDIQKSLTTFAVSEDSDKTNAQGKPEYKYTPGWEIIETIRKKMDDNAIMLIPNCIGQESKLIDYLVYKDFHGTAMSFQKKEMFVQVTMEFTWMDTQTGETAGPYKCYGYGANGTDKSGASAMSMAERYFLLRFFHFTTREMGDEQDAHDSGNIPGLPSGEQPKNLAPGRAVQATPAPQPWAGAVQPTTPQGQPFTPPINCPVMPQYGYGGQPQMPAGPQTMAAATPTGEFNQSDPNIQVAITALMGFEKGTAAWQRCLNEQIGKLSNLGYKCMNNDFVEKLGDTAQAFRNGSRKK